MAGKNNETAALSKLQEVVADIIVAIVFHGATQTPWIREGLINDFEKKIQELPTGKEQDELINYREVLKGMRSNKDGRRE